MWNSIWSKTCKAWQVIRPSPAHIISVVFLAVVLTAISCFVIYNAFKVKFEYQRDLIELCKDKFNLVPTEKKPLAKADELWQINVPTPPKNVKILSGETWIVKEGTNNPPEWIATWVVPSNRTQFDCKQINILTGEINTGECIVIQDWEPGGGGVYVAMKWFHKLDGNNCNYFGTRTGNSASGKYYCKSEGEQGWSATISRSD